MNVSNIRQSKLTSMHSDAICCRCFDEKKLFANAIFEVIAKIIELPLQSRFFCCLLNKTEFVLSKSKNNNDDDDDDEKIKIIHHQSAEQIRCNEWQSSFSNKPLSFVMTWNWNYEK